jgi:hypothetical protein
MGKEIGFREVLRMQQLLKDKIAAALDDPAPDSPVFLFLPQLLGEEVKAAPAESTPPADAKSLADLLELFRQEKQKAKKPADWQAVLEVLDRLQNVQPSDQYIIQQRALAMYKSEYPGVITSLRAAKTELEKLKPDTSSDAETVGLWGAIHKRLWNATKDRADLDKAIRSYGRGYFIKDDYYNGINFAFLLNIRASVSEGEEAMVDRALARRVRRDVLTICDALLDADRTKPADAADKLKVDDVFWINATKAEALLGLNRAADSETLCAEILRGLELDDWRVKSMSDQLNALRALQP